MAPWHALVRQGNADRSYPETKLSTHDLALPFPAAHSNTGYDRQPSSVQQRQLILLLTTVSVWDTDRSSLMSRIERFTTLATEPSPAIAFLLFAQPVQGPLSNSLHAYMTLQTL